MKPTQKIYFAAALGIISWGSSQAFAQTNLADVPAMPPAVLEPNIIWAMYNQVARDPACAMVIVWLCVMAWLADDTPIIPSRYVAHVTVVLGMATYWLFTAPSSVPKNFPHPWAVFMVNGTVCGFIAFLIHRQAVARAINFFRGQNQPAQESQTNKGTP